MGVDRICTRYAGEIPLGFKDTAYIISLDKKHDSKDKDVSCGFSFEQTQTEQGKECSFDN